MIKFSDLRKKKKIGVIPSPIHFKHVNSTISEGWFEQNDNTHLVKRKTVAQQFGNINVTSDQKKAIENYTGVNSREINKKLIKDPNAKHDTISHLDNIIKNNPIPEDLHVYSAVGFDPTKNLDEKKRFHSPAFISATSNKDIAFSFTKKIKDGIHHIIHLSLKKDDPATHIAEHSVNRNEEETLISRNVSLQHEGSHDFEDGGKKYRVHRMSIVR